MPLAPNSPPVAVEKLLPAKFAKIKLRQDALQLLVENWPIPSGSMQWGYFDNYPLYAAFALVPFISDSA